jgi:hypothetical protein
MPIYEYFSPETAKVYTFFARSLRHANAIPYCPDGKKYTMQKELSSFSVTTQVPDAGETENNPATSESSSDPFSDMAPGKAEKIMNELQGAIGSMDDDHPDPKQMGALMRKMCDLTGEKIDDTMEEVVRKLEEGKDPEELENDMDGVLDNDNLGTPPEQTEVEKLKRPMTSRVVRDPILYDIEDYL